MRYFLQMGHGMMNMNLELIKQFDDGKSAGVIVWPRTINRNQVERHAKAVLDAGASLLFDSCFYAPHTEREKILDYPYWDGVNFETDSFAGQGGEDFCRRVIEYQLATLQVDIVLLPGRYTDLINEDWLEMHRRFADVGASYKTTAPIYSTIAIGPDLLCDKASTDRLADELVNYPVSGFYFLYRPPSDQFLADDLQFHLHLLQLLLSLSVAKKSIVVGYANQQDLLLAAAGVETIASGNFRNVRRFNPEIFEEPEEEDRRRAVWFYDGRSLSEFRIQQLAIASQFGLRGSFGPGSTHSASLLASSNPAAVPWGEPEAFRHYLTVHRDQWLRYRPIQRSERCQRVAASIGSHRMALGEYSAKRFPLGDRSAAQALETFELAIQSLLALEANRLTLL